MQTLQLVIDLFPNLIDGNKLCTIRKGYRNIELGPLVFEATENPRLKYHVDVLEVEHMKLGDVTDTLAMADGYTDAKSLKEGMKRFYPDLTDDTDITIIYFDA